MKIEEIDKNFKPAVVGDAEVNYYNSIHAPFVMEGFPWGDKEKCQFFRLPDTLKSPDDVNDGALWHGLNQTSGGTVRFMTDATFITVRSKLHCSCDMNHMPRCGSAGFDLYVGSSRSSHHVGTAQPNRDEVDFERVIFDCPSWTKEMREWRINLPLYGGIETLEIGLPPDAKVASPLPHAVKPILFYGSSITQGGCASRPGNNYCSMLCRAVDAEQINLGFSGCGKGEPAVAKAIASLDLGAFVMDYDHNAPTLEHLQATHEPFFRIVREAHPDLSVIFMSKCNIWHDRNYETDVKRRAVIRETYEKAIAAGDRHVYFIDGETLFGLKDREESCVDGCHPNDLGFYRMYETVLPVLRKAIAEA